MCRRTSHTDSAECECDDCRSRRARCRRQPTIDIVCEPGDGELVITIEDQAKPFDPGSIPEPHLNTSLEEIQVGGLGLFFMRQVMDAVEFTTDDGSNKLVLVKRRENGAS